MALLGDNDFRPAVSIIHFNQPFRVFFRAGLRLLVLQIIFFAVDEHHDVGVLLDRTGLAKVGQLRMLVIAAFDLARQLRQGDDWNIEFFRQSLQAGGDLGDFLYPVVIAAFARALQQLDVVDHDQIEALLPFQPAGAGGELRNRQAAGFIDIEREMLKFDRVVTNLVELALGDSTTANHARRDAGLFGENTGGELFGRHFAGEEADDAAIDGFHGAVGLHLGLIRLRHIVGDVGGERGLAHAGTAGDDDQVGTLQPAHLGVEVAQARCRARQLAVALVGVRRHVQRDLHGLRETLEAAIVAAGFGQFVQPALGILDLRARRKIHRRVERDIDHVLADPNQVAAQRKLVDRSPVILGVDDGGCFGGEAGEVLADRHAADVGVGGDEGLQRYRGGDLAHPDQAAGGLVDGLMDRFEKCFGSRKSETR